MIKHIDFNRLKDSEPGDSLVSLSSCCKYMSKYFIWGFSLDERDDIQGDISKCLVVVNALQH